MAASVLDIRNLTVNFDTRDGEVNAVRGINCHVAAGECLGIVGESGSGKSQTFLASMGLLAKNGTATGEILFHEQNLLSLTPAELDAIRGDRISMIFQDPLTSLTPHMRIGEQMREVLVTHKNSSKQDADKQCKRWLDRVHIPDAAQRLRQYPHELSGGMRQRVMIAMCMLCRPELLIADEPSTALDVTIQAEILDLMDELRRDEGTAIVLITHDMGVVARMCDRIEVMRKGEFLESGTAQEIFYRPQHDYTKMLLDAVPRIDHSLVQDDTPTAPADAVEPLLDVDKVSVQFRIPGKLFARPATLRAVDNISFRLGRGETLGIVGESGSGKSTLARAILKLLPKHTGSVSWLGNSMDALDAESLRSIRKDLQIVFQDPQASLDPSMTLGHSIMEPLRVHEPSLGKEQRREQVRSIMEKVGLDPALINRYPHEMSGGQNQRVGIARAMVLQPRLVICDEAVSALDVSIQSQILTLLQTLQRESGVSYIFISHDLSVVSEISHRVLVMYLGRIVEMADRQQLFSAPAHPYTRQLISAVPIPDPDIERKRERIRLRDEHAVSTHNRSHLRFMPSKLASEPDYRPQLQERVTNHFVAEHDPLDSLVIRQD